MFGRDRSKDQDAASLAHLAVEPWEASGVRAEWAPFASGRTGRLKPAVQVSAGAFATQLHVSDLRKLVERRLDIAESIASPLGFLCWPEAAAPSSAAAETIGSLPRESLVFLDAAVETAPAGVVLGEGLVSFTAWVQGLPA